jgi:hypothetical protein
LIDPEQSNHQQHSKGATIVNSVRGRQDKPSKPQHYHGEPYGDADEHLESFIRGSG